VHHAQRGEFLDSWRFWRVGLPAENKSLIKGKHIIMENIGFIVFAS